MENFLSLPRSAKAGLAVLLAVALLGWGIVAYSSKRQHEDAKSLQQALATLDGKTEAEATVAAELEDISAKLETAEADLSATMQEKVALEDQVGQLEKDLGEQNVDVAALEESLAALQSASEASSEAPAEPMRSLGLVGDPGTDVDIATLRERLTKARTALSARSATLAQRDRELERTRSELDAANVNIEELKANLVEQGVLRERLNVTRSKLSGQTAMLAQRDRALASLSEDSNATLAKLNALEAEAGERAVSNQTLSSLQSKIDRTEQALRSGAEALSENQQKIADSKAHMAELQSEAETIEEAIREKEREFAKGEQALTNLSERIAAENQKLAELTTILEQRSSEIDVAQARLVDLDVAKAEAEADIASLSAEFEQQEAALSAKDDAIAYADTRLDNLEDEVAMAEKRIAETETLLSEKTSEFNDRQQEIDAAQATLSALKQDLDSNAMETAELGNAIIKQEAALRDLEVAKGDLEETTIELGYQRTLLSERQEQIELAETRLEQLQQTIQAGSNRNQTLAGIPSIPIAAISSDNLAVLPVDPTYEPFPIQTPKGIRLTQVHFDLGSADLTPGGLRKATEAATWIKAQDVGKIRLIGFTDSIGTKADNRLLAERRAKSLLRVFEEHGIDPKRIEIVAKGEDGTREVTADQTAEPLNRCVGVFIGADG